MFIIRYSIGCGQCLRPKMLSDIFQFRIHSAFAELAAVTSALGIVNRSRRKQRNPVGNVTKCYLIKILTQRNKQEYVN